MPKKLDDCVAHVKGKKGIDNPWAVCNAQLGKETKEDHNPLDIPFGYEVDNKTQEKLNANRMDGHSYRPTQARNFSPPITSRSVKPQIDKTRKGIGGQVGKIDSDANTNNMTTSMWKKILDAQLKRNVEEPRYS